MNLAKFTDRSERNGNVHHATRMSFFYNVSAYFVILMNLGGFSARVLKVDGLVKVFQHLLRVRLKKVHM